MKLIADATVLFALTKQDSAANVIVSTHKITLVAPEYALLELHKYKKEILDKCKETNFEKVMESLKQKVIFVDLELYRNELKKAEQNLRDPKDSAYLALAYSLKTAIWSNDADLKEQKDIDIFTTKDLIILLKNKLK